MLSESHLAVPNECVLNAWYARATYVLRACYTNNISANLNACHTFSFSPHPEDSLQMFDFYMIYLWRAHSVSIWEMPDSKEGE